MSAPDDATLAGYVLRVFGERSDSGRAYPEPGSFYAALVDATFKADVVNRALLALAFPALATMVNSGKTLPNGVRHLRDVAEGRKAWGDD